MLPHAGRPCRSGRGILAGILYSRALRLPLLSEDTRTCAFAAYNLGRADSAISMLEKPSSDPADTDDRMRLLGLCYLATGRVARAEELRRLARANVREVDEFLSMDLPGAEKALAAALQVSGATAMVKRVRRVAEALLAELGRIGIGDVARGTETELTLLIQTARESDAGRWIEAGAQAGVARLQLESGTTRPLSTARSARAASFRKRRSASSARSTGCDWWRVKTSRSTASRKLRTHGGTC